MVLLKLDRSDYDRINGLLGLIGNLNEAPLEGADLAAYLASHVTTTMPPAEARRLCVETDRQAKES